MNVSSQFIGGKLFREGGRLLCSPSVPKEEGLVMLENELSSLSEP